MPPISIFRDCCSKYSARRANSKLSSVSGGALFSASSSDLLRWRAIDGSKLPGIGACLGAPVKVIVRNRELDAFEVLESIKRC